MQKGMIFKKYLNLSENENKKDKKVKVKKQTSIKKNHSIKTPTENPEIKKEKITKKGKDSISKCEEEKNFKR